MRISVQTARLLDHFGVDGGFRLMHELGFEAADFGMGRFLLPADIKAGTNTGSLMDGPFEAMIPALDEIRNAAEKYGIGFAQTHAPFPSWEWGQDELNRRMEHVLDNSILVTAYLGAPYCVIHPAKANEDRNSPSPKEEWQANHDMYARLIPQLREYGVVACLENMFCSGAEGNRYAAACSDYSEAAQWVEALNREAGAECFGFCFDTGHCNLVRQNLRRAVLQLGSTLKCLHMHDNVAHLDQHLAPYMGSICWPEFLKGLREIGYKGDLNFETFRVLDVFPPRLHRTCLQLIAETGRLFLDELQGKETTV